MGDPPTATPNEEQPRELTGMGLFTRSKRSGRTNVKPTWRERRAAQRTEKAESRLQETEQQIHDIADQVRSDIKRSA
jgi:hypothetical protein